MKRIVSCLLPAWLAAAACLPLRPPAESLPPGQPGHLSLSLKVQWQGDGQRQSGRASWRADEERGKLLLFDPLHRPVLEIQCRGEQVLLISRRRNRFWQGTFNEALRSLWNIDLTLAELRAVIEEGRTADAAPRPGVGVVVTVRSGLVRKAVFTTSAARLQLDVLERRRRPGPVTLVAPPAGMPAADLAELLAHD